jgi:hypothetical protein
MEEGAKIEAQWNLSTRLRREKNLEEAHRLMMICAVIGCDIDAQFEVA